MTKKISTIRLRHCVSALLLLALACFVTRDIAPSHAATTNSVNIFANPGFEIGPTALNATPPGWGREFFDSNVGSSTGVDCTRALAGDCSARLDIGQSDLRLQNQSQRITFGHTSLYQILPLNTQFGNLTDRPDGLNLWLYIQPKFTDYPLVQVRFKAQSTIEMDYVFINRILGSTGNSTNGGEANKAVKSFVLPDPTLSQWNHLMRNVKQDWKSQMEIKNSTGTFFLPGFQLNETLFRVEIEAYFYKDPANGSIYGETVWADEAKLFVDTSTQPPPNTNPDPIPFPTIAFQDRTGATLGNTVTWAVFNSFGLQVDPGPAELIPPDTYTLHAYYGGQTIYTTLITRATSSPIGLPIFPLGLSKTNYIAFNSTVSYLSLTETGPARITFSAEGPGPSLVIVNVPEKPLRVERNGASMSAWTYNATVGTVTIQTATLGTFSIIFTDTQTTAYNYLFAGAGAVVVAVIALIGVQLWRKRTRLRSTTEISKNIIQPSNSSFQLRPIGGL